MSSQKTEGTIQKMPPLILTVVMSMDDKTIKTKPPFLHNGESSCISNPLY